jgi:hypothetical protein
METRYLTSNLFSTVCTLAFTITTISIDQFYLRKALTGFGGESMLAANMSSLGAHEVAAILAAIEE